MRAVTVTSRLRAAPEHVFDFVVDNRNDPLWCPLASDVQLVEGTPGAGAVYTFRQGGGIGSARTWLRTTEAERPRRVVWDNADHGAAFEMSIDLAPVDDGTLVTQTNRVSLPNPVLQALWWTSAHAVLRLEHRNLRRELER